MTDSDVDTVKVMMDDCRLLTDSDCESYDSTDWSFLGGNSDGTSSIDCVSEDDFLLLKHTPVESLGHKESTTEVDMLNHRRVRMRKQVTVADIVKEHALPLLPAKTLCMLRAVCKEWNAWIMNPFLAYKQALYFRKFSGLICQSPLDKKSCFLISAEPSACGIPDPSLSSFFWYSEKMVKSTCNGLMCYQEDSLNYYICNPMTMQQHSIPAPNYFHWPGTVAVLAFEPSTYNFNSNYELACAIPTKMDDDDAVYIVFEIFSSRSSSWRVCDSICTELIGSRQIVKGFYSNGVVFWEMEGGCLLALGLTTEEYGIMKLPEGSGPHCGLADIRGEICYIMPDIDNCRVAVFGGMKMELKCMIELHLGYSLQHFERFKVLGCFDNGEVLVILLDDTVIAYHTVEMTYQTLKSFLKDAQLLNFFPYVNSLVNVTSPAWDEND